MIFKIYVEWKRETGKAWWLGHKQHYLHTTYTWIEYTTIHDKLQTPWKKDMNVWFSTEPYLPWGMFQL